MAVCVSGADGAAPFRLYPNRSVVIVGDYAEVAEVENDELRVGPIHHADLERRLRERHPELDPDVRWTAGFVAQDGAEAVLRLWVTAAGIGSEDVERFGRAMRAWCESAGVARLTVGDVSARLAPDPDPWALRL